MATAGADLVSLLPASNVVGTIRARHPTIYVFTGGNEDAAFLSIYGFNLLLDGGDQKEISYWNFIKNYDKINVVLSTRASPECVCGISTILARKAIEQCHPKIGAFIGNLPARSSCGADNDAAKAILSVYEGLQAEGIKPYDAFTNSKMEPLTLYEVIGEGSLKMIVLNPERGAKELTALANAMKTGESVERLSVCASIAVVLIWQPFDHSKPTIRILYPGACPLEKLYASLEKLKGEECLRHVEFVSADREKYSSNLSLNARGSLRRVVPQPKVSSTLRQSAKSTAGVSPRIPLPPKTSALNVKPLPKTAHTEVKSRLNERNTGTRPTGTVKKSAYSPVSAPSYLRTAASNRSPNKTNVASGKPSLSGSIKKDAPLNKGTSAKPPTVPRKSFISPNLQEKKIVKASEECVAADKTVSETHVAKKKTPLSGAVEENEKKKDGPILADFTAGPQVPNSDGLLDGLEEPVKLHLISMDVDDEKHVLKTENATSANDCEVVSNVVKDLNKHSNVLDDGVHPVSVGLSNLIMAENSIEESVPVGENLSNNLSRNTDNLPEKLDGKTVTDFDQLNPVDEEIAKQFDISETKHDLDSVIQTLISESKNYDLTQVQETLCSPQDEVVMNQNGNASQAFQAQAVLEDVHAHEEHLPPISATNSTPPTKRGVGLVTKPKLSQPLYFDVVFVPHHGAHPALLDEAAAKAFAISVRSKRYILSGQDAGKPYILDGFIAAKNVWNKPELEIDVLPTHSTDSLYAFNNLKQAEMMEAGMNLRCAVDRCTVRLSSGSGVDADDCCSAFKFEL